MTVTNNNSLHLNLATFNAPYPVHLDQLELEKNK